MLIDINKKILIVGLGLLGGSHVKILKHLGFHISAITKEKSSIDFVLKEQIIDEGSVSLDEIQVIPSGILPVSHVSMI